MLSRLSNYFSIVACFVCMGFMQAQNVTLSLDGNDVLYSSDTDIGGFQFNVEGASLTGASGGAAADNGFMLSNSATTVIAFSLTGTTIPAGEGVLVSLSADGDITGLIKRVNLFKLCCCC